MQALQKMCCLLETCINKTNKILIYRNKKLATLLNLIFTKLPCTSMLHMLIYFIVYFLVKVMRLSVSFTVAVEDLQ